MPPPGVPVPVLASLACAAAAIHAQEAPSGSLPAFGSDEALARFVEELSEERARRMEAERSCAGGGAVVAARISGAVSGGGAVIRGRVADAADGAGRDRLREVRRISFAPAAATTTGR